MQDNRQHRIANRLLLAVAAIGVAAGLSACGGGGGGDEVVTPPPPPPPTPPPMGAARFGAAFAGAFGMAANTDPYNPAIADIIAISLTTDPLDVP